ncbi:MAG TPA: 16S rRNA (cytidine(1402)-2'-O)-methyltransferase [Acidimicrobiales bacterium]|nr:16S rRNA (cytidine(1402)-2'-O)-methyltransferase [Acidimicrobiales bacterium]
MSTARLVLVGTPIGNAGDLSPRAAKALATADVVACEDTRHTRKLLAVAGLEVRHLVALHQHNEASVGAALVERMLRESLTIALVTDAGMPAVSDPGERVVRAAIEAGVKVEAVPGPTAAATALALSGLPATRWCFEGFLPRKGRERTERLAALAAEARTTVLYEAPHRIRATLGDLKAACGGTRRVALAREMTKLFEEVWRGTLEEAVEHSAEVEPRGEYTLVLEGAPAAAPASDADVDAAVARFLAEGMSRKDAAAAAAAELGVPRRAAYDAANRRR